MVIKKTRKAFKDAKKDKDRDLALEEDQWYKPDRIE